MKNTFNTIRAIQKAQIVPPYIIRIKDDFNYRIVQLLGGKKLTLAKTLKRSQEILDPQSFVRPCRSHLINTRFIKKASETQVTLQNGFQLPISRRRKIGLMTIIHTNNNQSMKS